MELIQRKLNLQLPSCVYIMKPKFVKYKKQDYLTLSFPVLKEYLNPLKCMQGGFITAAFDNAFGILCTAESGGEAITTIDISTNYQRPIFLGDELIITVYIKQMGGTVVHMYGEAYNKANKLIATGSTNIMRIQNRINN